MTASTSVAVAELVRRAIDVYDNDPVALKVLTTYAKRLEEPLRVAIAGMVKAGKSTLLNAIIGEEIAPTDAGECTRVVIWYQYGDTPRVTLYPTEGEPRALAVRRVDGRLVLDLGETRSEEVARLVVDWPSRSLRDITLIDTPGIASLSGDVSARSTQFLTPEDAPSEADAIIYLMRHLHAADVSFLEAFRDTAVGRSGTVNALAVLSRADEVGAGRIDSLLSARDIAGRYAEDEALRALALGVVPIAGLLAQSARTLRQSEFAVLSEISQLKPAERERLLVSVDRFVAPTTIVAASRELRKALVERFGLFGLRLAAVLIRSGASDATALAHDLARRSGIDELLRMVSKHFHARAEYLKARAALLGVETLLHSRPRKGADLLEVAVERIKASAHEFQELRLLATARSTGLALEPKLAAEAEQLVGGDGVAPANRLGLPDGASSTELAARALDALRRWRRTAEYPLTDQWRAEVCRIVVRSCEAMLVQLEQGSAGDPRARGALVPEPGRGAGQKADEQPNAG